MESTFDHGNWVGVRDRSKEAREMRKRVVNDDWFVMASGSVAPCDEEKVNDENKRVGFFARVGAWLNSANGRNKRATPPKRSISSTTPCGNENGSARRLHKKKHSGVI